MLHKKPDNVLEHGAARDWHHGLGPLDRQRSQPRSVSARHDNGLQKTYLPPSIPPAGPEDPANSEKGKVQLNTLNLHILEQVAVWVKEAKNSV